MSTENNVIEFKTKNYTRANNIVRKGNKKVDRMIANNIVDKALADQETQNLKTDKQTMDNKMYANMKKSAKWFTLFAFICSAISTIESVLGVCTAITSPIAVLIFGIIMFLLQVAIVYYNNKSATVKKLHYKDFSIIDKFAIVMMIVSISCNYQFMKQIVNNDSLFYTCITLILASGLDILSRYFSRLAYNAKYRQYSKAQDYQEDASLLHKLYICCFGKLLYNLDMKYEETLNDLNEFSQNQKLIETDKNQNQKLIETSQNQNQNFENGLALNTLAEDVYLNSTLEKKSKKYHSNKVPNNYLKHKNTLSKIANDSIINKDTFNLDALEWRTLREYFEKDGLVYCKGKRTYKKSNAISLDKAD